MGHLAEFLRDTITRRAKDRPIKEKLRNEWLQAVTDLIGRLKQWVEDSNVENLLTCRTVEEWIDEEDLGRYKVTGLIVEWEGEQVFVMPRGRNILGFIRESHSGSDTRARGRVDVTNKRITFSILWAPGDDPCQWYIYDDMNGYAKPLTRDTFEAVLVSLLK